MAAETDIYQQISTLITPHAQSQAKPPFSEEQLVVMALLLNGKAMKMKEIFDWIIENFLHYRELAITTLWLNIRFSFGSPTREDVRFRQSFDRVFEQFEVPLRVRHRGIEQPTYEVSFDDGRNFLADLIEPAFERAGTFPFFRLPPELRNEIYEYVFQYPKSGICAKYHGYYDSETCLKLATRSHADRFDHLFWRRHGRHSTYNNRAPNWERLLRSRPLSTILAPLSVNRNFFDEAMPVFYGINRFHFTDCNNLSFALNRLAPARRKEIKHISLHYHDCTYAARSISSVLALEGLRKLDIDVIDRSIRVVRGRFTGKGIHTLIKKIRGIGTLTLHGDCKIIEKKLTELASRPRLDHTLPLKRKVEKRDDETYASGTRKSRRLEAARSR